MKWNVESLNRHYVVGAGHCEVSRSPVDSSSYCDILRLLIGAPEADGRQPGVHRGGAVYKCSADRAGDCQVIPFDKNGEYKQISDIFPHFRVCFRNHYREERPGLWQQERPVARLLGGELRGGRDHHGEWRGHAENIFYELNIFPFSGMCTSLYLLCL